MASRFQHTALMEFYDRIASAPALSSEHLSHQTQQDHTSKSFWLGHATRPVVFVDRPCGTGKTTALIESLQPDRKYLIVVPLLDEADRILKGAAQRGVTLYAPERNGQTKSQHLLDLTFDDQSIVCTHKLFLEADMSFSGYDVHIDEAVDVVWPMNKHVMAGLQGVCAGS